jgi:hypothetical protein
MKIVLSYRRSDTEEISGRIFDRLRSQFGHGSVFMDVDSIPLGVDFRRHIQKELEGCDALLAIIGPRWLGGGRGLRIKEEADFVRLEVETALQRDIPVVPVLVRGAKMPRPDQLPETLRDLTFRNAAEVDSGRDFHPHVDRVIRFLDLLLTKSEAALRVSEFPEAESDESNRAEPAAKEAAPQARSPPDRSEPVADAPTAQNAVWVKGNEAASSNQEVAPSDEAWIAPALTVSEQPAALSGQDQTRTATAGNQASPGTPARNRRGLRWAAAGLGLMALATGGIYFTGQQAAERTIREEQLRKDQEAAQAAAAQEAQEAARQEHIRKQAELFRLTQAMQAEADAIQEAQEETRQEQPRKDLAAATAVPQMPTPAPTRPPIARPTLQKDQAAATAVPPLPTLLPLQPAARLSPLLPPLQAGTGLIDEKALPADHPDLATRYSNLAGLYQAQGRYGEAEPLFRKALEIQARKLGPNHPDTIATSKGLADLLRTQGRSEEADALLKGMDAGMR